jgi:hypothetical protein
MASRSRELSRHPYPKHPLQITTRALKGPDFKFELLPLHSPLLGQSLLVSFPPLIDMLKFSGYSYLIRGQPWCRRGGLAGGLEAESPPAPDARQYYYAKEGPVTGPPLVFGACLGRSPTPGHGGSRVETTLGQACLPGYWKAPCAFKDSMIH